MFTKNDLKWTSLIFGVWLVVMTLFSFIFGNRFNLKSDTAYQWMQPAEQFAPAQADDLVSVRTRWDSYWYADIAENGYVYKGPNSLSNIVFFPAYPILTRFVSFVTGNVFLAGWLVSLVALFFALALLRVHVRTHHPKLDPDEVLGLLLVFPTAVFFNAVYTESLFLSFAVATFYFALKRQFVWAGTFALLAALTRVTGVLLVVPLLIEYLLAWKKEHRPFSWDVLALGMPALGLAGFFAYHWMAFGSPTIFFQVQKAWGRGFALNAEHFLTLTPPASVNLALDAFFVLVVLCASFFIWKRLRLSYAVYTVLGVLVPVLTGTLMSVGRYAAVLFPIFLLVAGWKRREAKAIWTLVSILLLALYLQLFVTNYWAG